MSYAFNREWLLHKFDEIRRRLLLAIEQLDDEQLNWQPEEWSHSISVLIKHIDGNIADRIGNGILLRRTWNSLSVKLRAKEP